MNENERQQLNSLARETLQWHAELVEIAEQIEALKQKVRELYNEINGKLNNKET